MDDFVSFDTFALYQSYRWNHNDNITACGIYDRMLCYDLGTTFRPAAVFLDRKLLITGYGEIHYEFFCVCSY